MLCECIEKICNYYKMIYGINGGQRNKYVDLLFIIRLNKLEIKGKHYLGYDISNFCQSDY